MLKLKPVSQSTISNIKKRSFRNVDIKKVGSNFSKCSECDFLKNFIACTPQGTEEWQTLINNLQKHLQYQSGCQKLYHSWYNEGLLALQNFFASYMIRWTHRRQPFQG